MVGAQLALFGSAQPADLIVITSYEVGPSLAGLERLRWRAGLQAGFGTIARDQEQERAIWDALALARDNSGHIVCIGNAFASPRHRRGPDRPHASLLCVAAQDAVLWEHLLNGHEAFRVHDQMAKFLAGECGDCGLLAAIRKAASTRTTRAAPRRHAVR